MPSAAGKRVGRVLAGCSKPEAGDKPGLYYLASDLRRDHCLGQQDYVIGKHFRCNLGHFTDSSRNGVLRGCLDSSLGRSFLVPGITYFFLMGFLVREARNVRLAALNLKGISEAGLGSQSHNGDFRNPYVSLKFICSHFLYNVTFLCKLRRIHVYGAHRNHTCCYSGHREHLSVEFRSLHGF